jgi:hypothetical protein
MLTAAMEAPHHPNRATSEAGARNRYDTQRQTPKPSGKLNAERRSGTPATNEEN